MFDLSGEPWLENDSQPSLLFDKSLLPSRIVSGQLYGLIYLIRHTPLPQLNTHATGPTYSTLRIN